jgi:hypothetical protein
MSRKPFRPPKTGPLQRVVAEPITDPDEIAVIDQMRKRLKRERRKQEARNGASRRSSSRSDSKKT